MKFHKVYAVSIRNPFNGTHLHREGFADLAAAQAFCGSQADCPRKVSEYRFESSILIYTIHELEIRVLGNGEKR